MKTNNNLYFEIISLKNLILAYKKARKGKTKRNYVIKFEENLAYNLKILHEELKNEDYVPRHLESFIIRDPKTRLISKSDFRDRIVHHALCNILEPIFDKTFIYDNCANRKGKGTSFAIARFETFQRKVTCNFSKQAFCLKADIKHYFQSVDRNILLNIIKRKIKCDKTNILVKLILDNFKGQKGMPLGNLTSQFFANLYLNELDYFIKYKLRIKYYIRYIDDFVILNKSSWQLQVWKEKIRNFIEISLKIELHTDKSKIIPLSRGIDFVGFRNFYYFRLLRNRNIRVFKRKLYLAQKGEINLEKFKEIFQGFLAYSALANSHNLVKSL